MLEGILRVAQVEDAIEKECAKKNSCISETKHVVSEI